MPADLTEFRAAAAAFIEASSMIEKREHDRADGFVADGRLQAHERYYELWEGSGVPLADRDRWMADNFPAEHAGERKRLEDAAAFRAKQGELRDDLHPQAEKALRSLGEAVGAEALEAMRAGDFDLDSVEALFDRMNEIIAAEMSSRMRVNSLMPGPCSNAFYGRIASKVGVDHKSKQVLDLVRAELSPAAALRY